jgi:hypothetical protein
MYQANFNSRIALIAPIAPVYSFQTNWEKRLKVPGYQVIKLEPDRQPVAL